jgi:hypothetical protein
MKDRLNSDKILGFSNLCQEPLLRGQVEGIEGNNENHAETGGRCS